MQGPAADIRTVLYHRGQRLTGPDRRARRLVPDPPST